MFRSVAERLRSIAQSFLFEDYFERGDANAKASFGKLDVSEGSLGDIIRYQRDGYVPAKIYDVFMRKWKNSIPAVKARQALSYRLQELNLCRDGDEIVAPCMNHRFYSLSGEVIDAQGYVGRLFGRHKGLIKASSFEIPTWMPFESTWRRETGHALYQCALGKPVTVEKFLHMEFRTENHTDLALCIQNASPRSFKPLADFFMKEKSSLPKLDTDPNIISVRNGVMFLRRNALRLYEVRPGDNLDRIPVDFIPYGDTRLDPSKPDSRMFNKSACMHINGDFDPAWLSY